MATPIPVAVVDVLSKRGGPAQRCAALAALLSEVPTEQWPATLACMRDWRATPATATEELPAVVADEANARELHRWASRVVDRACNSTYYNNVLSPVALSRELHNASLAQRAAALQVWFDQLRV